MGRREGLSSWAHDSLDSLGEARSADYSRRHVLTATLAAACFLFGLGLLAYGLTLRPALQGQTEKNARRVASLLTRFVAGPMSMDARQGVESALAGAFQMEDVLLVKVLRNDGTVLAHLGEQIDIPRPQRPPEETLVRIAGNRLWVTSPVRDASRGVLGTLVLGYSLDSQNRTLTSGLVLLLGIALAASVAFGAVARVHIRKHTLPLHALGRAARRIALGRDPSPLPLHGSEEVDQVVTSFNEMISCLQDSRKRLQGQTHQLEQAVQARTEELRRKNLALAFQNEKILEVSRLKSDFLANMSHELRTPLNGILALSELLRDEITGPLPNVEQKRQASMIHQSGETLLRLINDILDLSKIEAGRMEILYQKVRAGDLLQRALEEVRPLADQKALELRIDIEDSPEVWLDTTRVQQVFVNLLGNAIKFTERGWVSVRARVEADEERLTVKVEDSGVGIAPQDHEKIFQEFRQVDGSATRRFGGTGLGLAISRRLVRLMGGDIELVSDLGQGSRFTFWVQAFLQQPTVPPMEDSSRPVTLLDQARVELIDPRTDQNRAERAA